MEIDGVSWSLSARRAWIEIDGVVSGSGDYVSLSARRAWIEICLFGVDTVPYQVALRKESVDRNISELELYNIIVKSLSARRAWIEIRCWQLAAQDESMSLSARRAWIEIARSTVQRI